VDEDLTVDFARETTPHDVVSVIATYPLTRDEAWTTTGPGGFVVFRSGAPAFTAAATKPPHAVYA
jgi:predicted glutamine amidotransferase